MNTETNPAALLALSARLDFFAARAESLGLVDAETDPIPAQGGAAWPSTHPRWIAFLDAMIARRIVVRGTSTPAELRAELLAI